MFKTNSNIANLIKFSPLLGAVENCTDDRLKLYIYKTLSGGFKVFNRIYLRNSASIFDPSHGFT